ncbi:MAG TPA: helix-turn-helix domain-containing protein [Amycolatopsis sp.]|nr:helix-turn-helix domain-containing protein [Amycolatopsis sp.]
MGSTPDFAAQRSRDLKHVPTLPGTPGRRAIKAEQDAATFARDIRHYDPRQIWGRANALLETDPARLLAALVHLAARADPRTPEWTNDMGGIVALHPDYDPSRHRKAPKPHKPGPHDDAVVAFARKGHTDSEIARHLGLRRQTVNKIRGFYNLPDRNQERRAERDQLIAELAERGASIRDIAAAVGASPQTVERILDRHDEAAENARTEGTEPAA